MIGQLQLVPEGFRISREEEAIYVRRSRSAIALLLLLAVGLGGCHRKPLRSPLPHGALAPIALEIPEPEGNPPEIAAIPQPVLEPLPETPPPPARRRPAPPKEQPAQPQVADDTSILALGALSIGGDGPAHTPQQVQELIASVMKRISALSSQVASAQKKEIRQARNFLDQAQKALKSGDSEGANTLAVKANLLIDDVEKK